MKTPEKKRLIPRNYSDYFRKLIMDDEKVNVLLYIVTFIVLGITALVFSIANLIFEGALAHIVSAILFILSAVSLLMLWLFKWYRKTVGYFLSAVVFLAVSFFIISGKGTGFEILWAILIPTSGLMLLGLKLGTFLSVSLFAEMLLAYYTPLFGDHYKIDYDSSVSKRFTLLFIISLIISVSVFSIYSKTREIYLKNSTHDQLTGAFNRTGFVSEICRVRQNPDIPKVAYLITDIDKFKEVNDTYGHFAGDQVLIEIVRIIATVTDNPICRWGGEEFAVFIRDGRKAAEISERIRETIENHVFETDDGHSLSLTISVGVCITSDTSRENNDKYFKEADKALYEAKNSGRNRCIYSKLTD